jgi:hypothetical protein
MWISFFGILIIPESPKFLYSKGKYDKARHALRFMQRFNSCAKKVKPDNIMDTKFDIEIYE